MTAIPECCIATGDPQGIGPEVSVAAAKHAWPEPTQIVLVGARSDLLNAGADAAWPVLAPHEVARAPVSIVDVPVTDVFPIHPPPSPYGGSRALAALTAATDRVILSPQRRALVTAPVSKAAVTATGLSFSGHTGWLAARTGGADVVMLFEAPSFRVALATVHVPLAEVPRLLTVAHLTRVFRIVERDLQTYAAIPRPRLAVLGLNPHAGESGQLGQEESAILIPAIEHARASGMLVSGPFPADTFFRPGFEREADCTIAMYHDQGLLPVKCLAFGSAVNVTAGLPILRTSVDHGTAFDIAGKGLAEGASMVAACALALRRLRAHRADLGPNQAC